jgi:BirA family transcriptional regulator, biotin operon repressor / biotin---[acetyl-CoA-carboxylase] ligase
MFLVLIIRMSTTKFPGLPIIYLDEVSSTNNYASSILSAGNVIEGTVILTFRQTGGRGHGKNVWESENNKNLTFSLILFPRFLDASRQFLVSQVVSLGLADFLKSKTTGVAIKWPNDLLIHNKKTAGLLIENTIFGNLVNASVIGIGMNMNQVNFPDYLPNATSLSISTGKEYPLEESLNELIAEIFKWYGLLKRNEVGTIRENYLKNLFRIEEKSLFRSEDRVFEASIMGIDEYGQLLLEEDSGEIKAWKFKSIEMIF